MSFYSRIERNKKSIQYGKDSKILVLFPSFEWVKNLNEIILKARAKINLTLDVTGKRQDGYHILEMIMQTVSLYDKVYVKKIDKPVLRLKSNLDWLPTDERNLAYMAAKLLKEEFQIKQGIFIELDKRIPVAAGLAGGSADCAAVLVAVNRLFGLRLSKEELMKYGLRLGADVPYCIVRGTVLAKGIGEILTPIAPQCPFCYVVLIKLPISVSTAFVYKNLSLPEINMHPNTKKMLQAIQNGDLKQICDGLCNVLETVTISHYPEIELVKKRLLQLGAKGSLMSGSGPTVFGIFEKKETAQKAVLQMKEELKIKDIILTTIFHINSEYSHWKKQMGRGR